MAAPGNAGAAALGPTAPQSAGSLWSNIAASAGRAMATSGSTTSAFDRPQSVLIAGPKPLTVVHDPTTPLLVHVTNFSQFPGAGTPRGAGSSPRAAAAKKGSGFASLIGPTLAAPLAQVAAAATAARAGLAGFTSVLAPLGRLAGGVGRAVFDRAGTAAGRVGRTIATKAGRVGRIAGVVGRAAGKAGGGAAGVAGGAIGAAGKALVGLGVAAQAAGQAVLGAGQAMAGFVAKANPAALQMFERAVEDLTAVVGQALTPVFNLVTQGVRLLADALTPLAPIGATIAQAMQPAIATSKIFADFLAQGIGQFGKVVAGVAPAFEAVGVAVLAVLEAFRPLFELLLDLAGGVLATAGKALATAVTAAVPYISAFAKAIGSVVEFVSRGVRDLLALVGINLPKAEGLKEGSSVGAAVRQAQFGQVGDALRKAQTSAYTIGNAAANPQALIAQNTADLKKRADDIYDEIRNLPENIARKMKEFVTGGAKQAAESPAGRAGAAAAGQIPILGPVIKGSLDLLYNRMR